MRLGRAIAMLMLVVSTPLAFAECAAFKADDGALTADGASDVEVGANETSTTDGAPDAADGGLATRDSSCQTGTHLLCVDFDEGNSLTQLFTNMEGDVALDNDVWLSPPTSLRVRTAVDAGGSAPQAEISKTFNAEAGVTALHVSFSFRLDRNDGLDSVIVGRVQIVGANSDALVIALSLGATTAQLLVVSTVDGDASTIPAPDATKILPPLGVWTDARLDISLGAASSPVVTLTRDGTSIASVSTRPLTPATYTFNFGARNAQLTNNSSIETHIDNIVVDVE